MPKSFLVKKSESPPAFLSRSSQAEKSAPKHCTSSEDSENGCHEEKSPLQASPVTIETKWEPLDTSEYERCIENAHALARERHLPWLRPQGTLAAPLPPQFPRRHPALFMEYPLCDMRAVGPNRIFPAFDVESRSRAIHDVKTISNLKFHSENSAFERFVRHPQGRELNLFLHGLETERKPDINLLSRDVTTSRRIPQLVRNPASHPSMKRKSHSETKTAAEPAPKKSRTPENEPSPNDSEPSEVDSAREKLTQENSQSEKPFKCSHCVMSFTRPSDLQRHLLIHNNNKPYKCEECDREFTWFGNFQKHILSHVKAGNSAAGSRAFSTMFTLLAHDQVKDLFIREGDKYRCRLCSKDFTRLSGLKTHIRMHTGERPFVCQVCSFAFTTSRALKMHTRLHTGEKPYKCEVCDRAFTRRDEMHTHMYIHKGEKPFKCDKCSASFIRYGHLQRHLLIHSDDKPYKCKLCPKSFTQYRNLQTHMYKHTGERPYRCKFCPKGFTQYGTLQAHERTHTGEKPFKCQMCDKAFITSSHLRWHIKTQHGQE